MDTEDQEDERNTDIPEEVTELDNSMEHIMDENTRISIISKILNTLLIIKVFTHGVTKPRSTWAWAQASHLKVINIPEVWFVHTTFAIIIKHMYMYMYIYIYMCLLLIL